MTDETFSGLLLLDKPPGVTSHDAVLEVRRRLGSPGAGHLGTLDPPASGLLLVAMGAATRAIPVWTGGEKTYDARVRFGLTTSTQDLAGDVLTRASTEGLTDAGVREAALRFVGEITQIPPMVSALKVEGERLHRLARRGVTVERAPRPVRVREWEWLGFELPDARFRVRCSGGTYVRTLAHDLGAALGCGAALAELRRTAIGSYQVADAASWETLVGGPAEATIARAGVPLDRALEVLPAIELDADGEAMIGTGRRPVVRPGAAPLGAGPRSIVLRSRAGRALALGELLPREGRGDLAIACPHVVFPWAVRRGGTAADSAAAPADAAPRSG